MRFSIRDLLLVTLCVALALGWWIDRGRQSRSQLAVEQLLTRAEAERLEAVEDRAMAIVLRNELMKDLDLIHPGWRKSKWQEIPKPIHRNTDAREARKRGKAWAEFQAMKNAGAQPNSDR